MSTFLKLQKKGLVNFQATKIEGVRCILRCFSNLLHIFCTFLIFFFGDHKFCLVEIWICHILKTKALKFLQFSRHVIVIRRNFRVFLLLWCIFQSCYDFSRFKILNKLYFSNLKSHKAWNSQIFTTCNWDTTQFL